MTLKSGALSEAELLEIWKGALDKSYRDPLLHAGEGNGLEAHTQGLAQLARVSKAIDKTTQAMFICPWSGQSDVPAEGARKAQVVLTFQRTKLLDRPMVLGKGLIVVGEQTTDWGDPIGVTVATGRKYVLTEDLVFHPGETGPFDVPAEAVEVGTGFNNPLPGTIKLIDQPGYNFENNLATVTIQNGLILDGVVASSQTATVITPNEPDTFVPEHVGQYVQFTGGNNVTKIGRILQFTGPDLSVIPAIGSQVIIEWTQSVEGVATGTFIPGEQIKAVSDFFGTVLGTRAIEGSPNTRLSYVFRAFDGTDVGPGFVFTGQLSGATLTVQNVLSGQNYVAEAPVGIVGGASWRILDWAISWGVTCTNVLSPENGVHGWLDELGSDRNLARAPGEDDSTYRQRIKSIADVVSPNAIRRTLSRTLGAFPWCFREVGTEGLPGFFYDGDNAPPSFTPHGPLNDAYDYDTILLRGITAPVGTFQFQEPVEYEDSMGNNFAIGWLGRAEADVVPPFWNVTIIRKNGSSPSPIPVGAIVRGTASGAYIQVSTNTPNPEAENRRFRQYFDYSQFRGFFIVCLPALGLGEFGFAYDDHPMGAFDAPAPFENFFDGYPYLNNLVYSRVYQAIDEVKAGGVLFDLCLDDGSCP